MEAIKLSKKQIVDAYGRPITSIGRSYRKDYIGSSSSSKGTSKDPLSRQRTINRVKYSDSFISDLYATNRVFANIVDIPAEDTTREWISIEGVEDKLREQIVNKLSNLGAQNRFQEAMKYERLRGDGLISIGVSQKGDFNISEAIERKRLVDIDYIHAFSGMKLVDYIENDDVFSKDYGDIELYEIADSAGTKLIHSDRIAHIVTRKVENEKKGIPLIEMLYDTLLVLDNALWSTGQLMYSMVHKRLKTDGIDLSDKDLRRQMQDELEYEFNTLSLAIVGQEDELDYISPNVSLPLKEMYDFIWEMLSCISRMPKSHIMGQAQGTITGGQFDSLNYYMRIAGLQEAYLREPIEYIIDLSLLASGSDVGTGSINPENVKYKLKFNPLWKLDAKTDAEIRKIIAETDNMYLLNSVLSPGEVREKRFSDDVSLIDKIDMSDEEMLRLAKEVNRARKDDEDATDS